MAIIGGVYLNGVNLSEDATGLSEQPQRPDGSDVLWRYMDFGKFTSLLHRKALFFPRVDKLGDPFEGSLSRPCKNRIRDWANKTGDHDMAFARMSEFVKKDRERVVVSCWHELEYESEAMWKQYARGGEGIAVRTDFGSLVGSLGLSDTESYKDIRFGRVSYVDYGNDDMRLFNGMLFFHKRRSFDHEREVRVAKWFEWKNKPNSNVADLSAEIVDGSGIYWPVDLEVLIHAVVVSPLADDWFVESVRAVTERFCAFDIEVKKSTLATPPDWSR